MLHELRRKLGPAGLEERGVYPVDDDPYISVTRVWRESGEELDIQTKGGRSVTVRSPRWSVLDDGDSDDGDIKLSSSYNNNDLEEEDEL
ncbi:hypothetical protein PENSPDRAFT_656283 [Peniophora sp. CONT]|nr:hypothetical protein PENSPDRAFT_656283 [Peniophora sp. CONT]